MMYQVMLTIGIILLFISLFTLRQSLSFLKKSERVTGKVIEMKKVTDNDGITYQPVFQFKTNLNEERFYTYPISSSPAAWDIGDKANIAYNPNDPNATKVLTYFGTFGRAVILLAIGMPFLVISIGFYLCRHLLA